MTPTTTTYLEPIIEAAKLLQLKPYPSNVEQLAELLEALSPQGYPADVMPRLEALRAVTSGVIGSVEELAILKRVLPDWSGDKRYTLTATTLTWAWSSKHSGRYARVTVPFPTFLPMQVEVERFCDMDDQNNHSDECDPDADDCNCEGFIEQTVSATVSDWDATVEAPLAEWLARAVTEQVEPATFAPVPAAAKAKAKKGRRS